VCGLTLTLLLLLLLLRAVQAALQGGHNSTTLLHIHKHPNNTRPPCHRLTFMTAL
jgi:hypothetical protein